MNRKQKKNLARILIAAALVILFHFLPFPNQIVEFICYLIPYFIVGYDILLKALKGIKNKEVFDENFLMTVATIGSMALGEYRESVAVMLFYQIGEFFQNYAVRKSRKNISELMDIRPDYANKMVDGEWEKVSPDEVSVGEEILVKVGEKIPLDGVVIEGESSLNTSALTGESRPRDVKTGDEVSSGCINMVSPLHIRTTKAFGESTVSKILDLVENATSNKSQSENFISKFAYYYTPAVCYSALFLAIVPPLFTGIFLHRGFPFDVWIYRALTFLVISCPCALVISIPLSFFGGIGGASNAGILIKGSSYLEDLSKASTVAFDKTGTMTMGIFEVTTIHNAGVSEEELLKIAAHAEIYSPHPIARSILKEYKGEIDESAVESTKEISGKGISAVIKGHSVLAGNEKLMKDNDVEVIYCHEEGTIVHIAVDGVYKGHIHIGDRIKPSAKEAISRLHNLGVKKTVMLTGDDDKTADEVSKKIGISETHAELLPQDKVEWVEKLRKENSEKEKLIFVGDGINDAPVIASADIGIAMGALGSDAAIEAADVVLMDDDPLKIAKAVAISRKCMRIVYENIWFAIGVKVICLILGALGFADMWLAIFADVGVMVLAVLNALRCLRVKNL